MAEKKKDEQKIVLERVYVIPLARETRKAPYYRKSKKAVSIVKQFISKHMKSKDISIGIYLNKKIWEHGIKNPPVKVKITATKDDKGRVFAELFGVKKESEDAKAEKPKEEQKPKIIDVKAEKIEEAKEIEKEEIRELQHEHPKHHAPKAPLQQKTQETHPPAPKSL